MPFSTYSDDWSAAPSCIFTYICRQYNARGRMLHACNWSIHAGSHHNSNDLLHTSTCFTKRRTMMISNTSTSLKDWHYKYLGRSTHVYESAACSSTVNLCSEFVRVCGAQSAATSIHCMHGAVWGPNLLQSGLEAEHLHRNGPLERLDSPTRES